MKGLRLRSLAYGAGRAVSKAALALVLAAAPAAAEEVTIAALGDSLTAGYGLPTEEGFVPQLQDWLAARGHDVQLINAGVSGDTTAGGLARLGWTLTDDVDALIVALGGNDLLRGIAPEVARANLDAILQGAEGRPVLLVGLEAPGNFGPDYKRDFDAIWSDLAETHGALLYRDFLGPVRAAVESGTDRSVLIQPDGLHPTARGVALMVEGIGPAVEELIDGSD
ncbi:arylesterase [Rhodobacterales bacterium HKCCE3408]|nr:arylesterase [Rhodobacterales bacterium HKCCE3408]